MIRGNGRRTDGRMKNLLKDKCRNERKESNRNNNYRIGENKHKLSINE